MILKTFDELKARLIKEVEEHNCMDEWLEYQDVDTAVFWFVAMSEASSYQDFRMKDIASILLEGTKPIDKKYVEWWLETIYADAIEDEEYLADAETTMTNLINWHFGWDSE